MTRTVHCLKYDKELPGLDHAPIKGEIGERIYNGISKDAWDLWVEHSTMVINEYRLNPSEPEAQKILIEQMEEFFFGDGAALPPDYVPPQAK